MENNKLSLIYAIITILLWWTVATASKLMLGNISNFQLMFYIAFFSTISTFIIVIFTKKINITYNLIKKEYLYIIPLWFLWLGFQQFLYFTALMNAPTAQINVLNYMWPIFILVLSKFILKEKFSFKTLLSFILGIIWVFIVITKWEILSFQIQYFYWYFLALWAAFLWAIFSILNKIKNYDSISSIFLFNFVWLIFMYFLMFYTNSSFQIPLNELIWTLYIGLFPTAIAFILWIKALQIGKASLIANLWHLTPFVSLIFILVILNEKILISEVIGLFVIISGILLQIQTKKLDINK